MEYHYEEKDEIKNNITFIVAYIKEKIIKDNNTTNKNISEEHYLFGFCVINGCSEEDYKQILISINNDIKFIKGENIKVNIYNLKEEKNLIIKLIKCIPLFELL